MIAFRASMPVTLTRVRAYLQGQSSDISDGNASYFGHARISRCHGEQLALLDAYDALGERRAVGLIVRDE